MANIDKDNKLEKIYTPEKLTMYLLSCLKEFYTEPITEFLEPAAGDGKIIDILRREYPSTPILAYDIMNESARPDIIEADFLKTKIDYKKGRITVMNPPFTRGTKFIYKCLQISDYVVSITAAGTFVSLDWDIVEADAIRISKKTLFENGKTYDIAVLCLRKK